MKITALAVLLFAAAAHAGPETKLPPPATNPTFERLKSFAGDWVAKDGSQGSYSVVSGGNAVMEKIMMGPNDAMITMFVPDGDAVVVTHYCAVGNTPRMRGKLASPDSKTLSFAFLDALNVKPGTTVMNGLSYEFDPKDPSKLTEDWTSIENGKAGDHVKMELTRKGAKPAPAKKP